MDVIVPRQVAASCADNCWRALHTLAAAWEKHAEGHGGATAVAALGWLGRQHDLGERAAARLQRRESAVV